MVSQVKKRDGTIVLFNKDKIVNAIFRAATAVGGKEKDIARELADQVEFIVNERFKDKIPTVEEVQDLIEDVLIDNKHSQTAKAYIKYREKRREIREAKKTVLDVEKTMQEYLGQVDWRVNENSNVGFSIGGLILYISGKITANYWLNNIYPAEVKEAHNKGDFHLHDLSMFTAYCGGWSLKQLLVEGFGGVSGQLKTVPPKHFDTVIGQMVNFLGTMQNEWAGAQALSSVDTYLAPYVRHDNMSYTQLKQQIQRLLFNIATPSRWGMQCVSVDTEALTDKGWKKYNEIKKEKIATFNIKTKKIEYLKPSRVMAYDFDGELINLKNRVQDQLVTSNHKVVRKVFNADRYELIEAEDLMQYKTPIQIPIASLAKNKKEIDDNLIKLFAWIIAEGSFSDGNRNRVYIFQSKKHIKKCNEIRSILKNLKLKWDESERGGGFSKIKTIRFRLNQDSSRKVRKDLIGKKIPELIKTLSVRQIKLFLETYVKGDGHIEKKGRIRIYTKDSDIRDSIQELCVLCGYGTTINKRDNGVYSINIIRNNVTNITSITKKRYKGKVWCPTTKNGTFIARRNGKVFITGNTPFINFTFDWTVPEDIKEQNVILGGKLLSTKYKDYQKEMDMINRAFLECMVEGDASGRIFTFPIPTYNITREFDWDSENSKLLFDVTAKYGIPYFQNFINSSLKPTDVRSMCLHPDEELIIKEKSIVKRVAIKELMQGINFDTDGWADSKDIECLSLNPRTLKTEWVKVKRYLKKKDNKLIVIKMRDGKTIKVSRNHLVCILTKEGIKEKFAEEIKEGDYLINLKNSCLNGEYQKYNDWILDEDLAKILGFFTADGNYLFETRKNMKNYGKTKGLQFTFNSKDIKLTEEIEDLLKKRLGCKISKKQDPRYNSYYIYVYNTEISRAFYGMGFKKYGRLPNILFGSPKKVIKEFLKYFFVGDGYEKRKEIHINDKELARDLVLLYSLIGIPNIYRERENSQIIYLQNKRNEQKSNGNMTNPLLHELVPSYFVSTYLVPGLTKNRVVGLMTLKKYNAENEITKRIEQSDIYPVKVSSVLILDKENEFYDIELEKNHLFIHSLGTVTHNCCRLQLNLRELRNKTGGLFGSGELTGSIGVVTINLPRIGFLSKTKEEFLERLGRLMDIGKTSLEIKRKVVTSYMEAGLTPYTKRYLGNFNNHFATIGLVGMNETLLNFMGKDIATDEGRKFALDVLDFMREKLQVYQKETGNIYNLEATPAEGSLAPEERVLVSQSDPSLKEIGPLVDSYMEKNKEEIYYSGETEILRLEENKMHTYGFDKSDQKMKRYPVTALVRHRGKSMYEIETASGRKVKVTGQHSVFTLDNEGIVKEVYVSDLNDENFIAIPKKISMDIERKEINLVEMFKNCPLNKKMYLVCDDKLIEEIVNNKNAKKWASEHYKFAWKDVKFSWKKSKKIPLRIIYDLGIEIGKERLNNFRIFYRETKNTKEIKAVIKIDKDFGFFVGSILAEGWIGKRSEFSNTDREFADRYKECIKSVFGENALDYTKIREKRKEKYVIVTSKMIGIFLEEILKLKGKSNEKEMPNCLFVSSEEAIKGVLQGFGRGDGSIYRNEDKSDYNVRLYTNSKKLAEGLNILLLRLGILAKIRVDKKSIHNTKWNDNFVLSISGAGNLKKYYNQILEKEINLKECNSGREFIPYVPRHIKRLMEKNSITSESISINKDSFNRNIRKNKISIQYLRKVIEKLDGIINSQEIENLKILVNSDLYWDRIKEVRKLETPRYVYDLEVDIDGKRVNNFLGGEGLVCLHNTSYRLARMDKQMFPGIITAGKDEPYYTNSTHLPVNYTDDIFEALNLQDELQCKYTGGTVFHTYLGEKVSSSEACKELVKKIAYNYRMPYFTISPTFSVCPRHGYLAGAHEYCPKCDEEIEAVEKKEVMKNGEN